MSSPSYETVPFPGRPIAWTHPAALSLVSLAHGGRGLSLDGPLRVLEVGCGDAANLVALAHFDPKSTFVGLDSSRRALDDAERAVAALGLENLTLVHEDLAIHEPDGVYDVVIAHGVYSWVGLEHRAALRALMRRALRDGGLAYASFNAEPGWSVRGRVRDALVRERPGGLEEARARLQALRTLIDDDGGAWGGLLAHELELARDASDAYLAHEYLSPHNESFWVGDVARDFEAEGLHYLGEASFDRPAGFVPPDLRERARAVTSDRIALEEHLDLRLFRQHRGAVFSTEAPSSEGSFGALVESAFLASPLARQNDPFDITAGAVEPFVGSLGREVRVGAPVLKMALLLLADRYPEGISLPTLRARCEERLDDLGVSTGPSDFEELGPALTRLATELQVELRLHAPPLRLEPGERPCATPLTRWEARSGEVFTTPLHTSLPREPIDAAIVQRLDGARTRQEVAEAVAAGVADGTIPMEGAPAGLARIAPWVEARVQTVVTTLGWWGLCA